MKNFYTIVLIGLVFTLQGFAQKKTYLSNAVNLAGKQRMLGQRMAKNKLYIKSNKKREQATKELKITIKQFESGLKILKDFAPTKALQHKAEIEGFAFEYYKQTILESSRKSLRKIIKINTIFLAICDDLVTELTNYSKTRPDNNLSKNQKYIIKNIAMATNASGKLRYLTQRLTLYYAMNEYGQKKVSPQEIDEIITTMDNNLNYLTVLEFNTVEIDDALSEVYVLWTKLKKVLYVRGIVNMNSPKINAEELYDLCNKILGKANTATKMYADLNKS